MSFVCGRVQYFADLPGTGSAASFNGAFGIAFDRTESYAFISSSEGKKIRKLSLASRSVGTDISCKLISFT